MRGLSLKSTKAIGNIIKLKFDSAALRLFGLTPTKNKDKNIIFSTSRQNLISLFLQGLGNRTPNKNEENALKVMLSIANSYVDSLKDRTIAKVTHELDAYIKEQTLKSKEVSSYKVKEIVNKNFNTALNNLKLIANAESNKAVNTGTALQISKIGEQKKQDPTVFFIVTIDERNDPETYRLHLLPDRLTPRVYKLSELGTEYHKKGDPWPKIQGTNPNCFVGNKGVQVLTEKNGYKNIKDIIIGDRVLTHTGKFKRVLNTLEWYDKKYYGNFIKIKYKGVCRDGLKTHTLKVTPDHEFLTQRGWVKAKDLSKEDCFRQLLTPQGPYWEKTNGYPEDIYDSLAKMHMVIRESPILRLEGSDATKTSNNHTENYFFDDVKLESVEFIKNHKGAYKLYDITVEDDESFVVNGIVSHNCRCKITYLADSWGFKDGKVSYKGLGWDEYKYQRKEYGLPPKLLK